MGHIVWKQARRRRWLKYANPKAFYGLSERLTPYFSAAGLVLLFAGLIIGFVFAPSEARQGEVYRIIYLHVPVSWLSMVLFLVMAFWGAVGFVTKIRMAFFLMRAVAPTGALMTVLSLVTGAIWGKPTWGAWWVWDARLTSEFILLFLYAGVLLLYSALGQSERSERMCALLAIVGAVNVPIIYFSVKWWATLHQGASVTTEASATVHPTILWALLLSSLGLWMYVIAVALKRARLIVLEEESDKSWVRYLGKANLLLCANEGRTR